MIKPRLLQPQDTVGGGNEYSGSSPAARNHDGDPPDVFGDRPAQQFRCWADLPVLPNNHGPQTDRLVYGLGRSRLTTPDPTSREVGLYDQTFIDKYIQTLSNAPHYRQSIRRSVPAR
jgi:hypothetical protein